MEQYSGVSVGLGYATVGARDEGCEGRAARGEPPHAWRGAEAEGTQTTAANEARVEVWARPGETRVWPAVCVCVCVCVPAGVE